MFGLSIWHILIVLIAVALFFGRGRISRLMGDLGRGINAFRSEMKSPDTQKPLPPPALSDGTKSDSKSMH